MCFVRYPSWIVCTVWNVVPMSFFRLRKVLMRISAFPLRPRYIRCSTMITQDIVEFDWFKTTCLQVHMLQYRDHSGYCWIWLTQNNLSVAKICCGHQSNFRWLGRSYFSVTLSCKVPYFYSNFHVVTPRTAECGLCFPVTSVSGTVTCIWALWYAAWCMGGWLVLGLRAVPLI